jgi:hypothetical protein
VSSIVPEAVHGHALAELSSFRMELYAAMPRRADALFDLTDAVLCAGGLNRPGVFGDSTS